MGMTRYLLDSNAVTSMANNRTLLMGHLENARQRGCRIGTCEPVIAELFCGLEMSASRPLNQELMLRCLRYLKVMATRSICVRNLWSFVCGPAAARSSDAGDRYYAGCDRIVAGQLRSSFNRQ